MSKINIVIDYSNQTIRLIIYTLQNVTRTGVRVFVDPFGDPSDVGSRIRQTEELMNIGYNPME